MVSVVSKTGANSHAARAAVMHALLRWSPALASVASLLPLVLLYWQVGGPSALLSDPNTGLHVRTGEWILVHRAAPKEDLFSFSIQGRGWCDWEWLSDILYALPYRWDGLAGIASASLGLLSGIAAVIYYTACVYARPAIALAVTFLTVAATAVHWLARPHLFSWLLLAMFCWFFERFHATGRKAWLLPMPVLMLIWVNLHPGFVVGLAMLTMWFLGAVIDWIRNVRRKNVPQATQLRESIFWLGLIFLACLATTLVNPYGLELHRHVLWYLFSPSSVTTHVREWLSPDFQNPRLYWFALLVPACAAAGFRSATRAQFAWSAMTLSGLFLALMAVRNVPLCAVLCAAPVASFVEETIGQLRPCLVLQTRPRALASAHSRIIASCALAVAGLSLSWVEPPHLAPDCSIASAAAAHLRPGRLFTTDSWADYLIFMDPSRRVFIDCRNDLYGPDLVDAYLRVMEARPGWQEILTKYSISVALVPRTSAISAALAASTEWRLSYENATARVFERL